MLTYRDWMELAARLSEVEAVAILTFFLIRGSVPPSWELVAVPLNDGLVTK